MRKRLLVDDFAALNNRTAPYQSVIQSGTPTQAAMCDRPLAVGMQTGPGPAQEPSATHVPYSDRTGSARIVHDLDVGKRQLP